MSGTVMIQRGAADGRQLPGDGQYLQSFDFEAHGGQGDIALTPDLSKARVFADFAEAAEFWRRSPVCKPLREDGRPNRPLTAANWEFVGVDSIRVGA